MILSCEYYRGYGTVGKVQGQVSPLGKVRWVAQRRQHPYQQGAIPQGLPTIGRADSMGHQQPQMLHELNQVQGLHSG